MVAQYRQQLERVLSQDRMAAYAPSSNDDLETVVNYFWNIALCQSLYPCLGSLEVAVRNSIHATLRTYFNQDDWYDRPNLLQRQQAKSVLEAKKKVRNSGRQETPGRVIAALSFGFWTSLLDRLYGNAPTGPQLWVSPNSPLLIMAFPHAPGHARGVRGPIFNRLDDIRLLRNRVFHYERIYHGIELPARRRGRPLRHVPITQMHTDIIDMIGWVDLTLQATAQHLDAFARVHQQGYSDIEREIKNHLGLP